MFFYFRKPINDPSEDSGICGHVKDMQSDSTLKDT